MIPLIDDPCPCTHMVSHFCEIRIPEHECDFFDENPEVYWLLVKSQLTRCSVVVTAVIYDELDGEDDDA